MEWDDVTNLYLYHNDSNSGLRVLHLLYNKARIGYSSDPDAVGKRTSHMNIVRDRYTIDMIRGMSYTLVLADHSTACWGILCKASLRAWSGSDMMCRLKDRQLLVNIQQTLTKSKKMHSKLTLTVARFTVVVTLLTSELGLEEAFRTFWVTLAGSKLPSGWTFNALISTRTTACITAQITFNATTTIAVIAENDVEDNENDNFVVEVSQSYTRSHSVMMNFWCYWRRKIKPRHHHHTSLARGMETRFCVSVIKPFPQQVEFIKLSSSNKKNWSKCQTRANSLIGLVKFNFKSQILFTYPSAQVARHSPLCSCNPFTHSVQFIRETHWVQVCKQRVQIPASMKYPLSHVLTHLLFWRSKLFEHVKQSFSVGPMHVSQVEWHEWQRPLSEYSAKGYFFIFYFFKEKENETHFKRDGRRGNQQHMWNCNKTFMTPLQKAKVLSVFVDCFFYIILVNTENCFYFTIHTQKADQDRSCFNIW